MINCGEQQPRRRQRGGLIGLYRIIVIMVASFSAGLTFRFRSSLREPDGAKTGSRHRQFMSDGETETYFGNPRNRTEVNGTVCFRWSEELEADQWWNHHPSFEPFSENDDGACFIRMPLGEKSDFFNKLHSLQYDMDKCPQVHTRHMWSTGWGSDFKNIAGGLLYGIENDRPFQISFVKEGYAWQEGWHYSAFKPQFRNGRPPVCRTKDMFCYFLPLSLCPPWNMNITPANPFAGDGTISFAWANEYATRQKMWLRKNVYVNIKTKAPPISLPCAAIHVRRTDVALEETWARQHFAISDYLQKLKEKGTNTKNILLFTDDENALEEALEVHPEYNWMYLNISRHKGSSGYENHIAANNPANEVIALLSIFKLAKQCDTFVTFLEVQICGYVTDTLHRGIEITYIL
eukprot:scaffold2186_cov94-Skeletonema_marinoi.AAC.1